MNVIFNGAVLRRHNSGVGNYAYQLLRQFSHMRLSNIDLSVSLPQGMVRDGIVGDVLSVEYHHRFCKYLPFDGLAWGKRFAVYHEPNFVPACFPNKTVVTVHDMSYRLCPQYHSRSRVWSLRFFEERMKAADAIITVSESAKRDIVDVLGVDDSRVVVTYLGAESMFRLYEVGSVEQRRLRSFGVGDNYILYVGTIEPRKNLVRLLEAFAAYREASKSDLQLVLAGGNGWLYEDIYRAVERLQLKGAVCFTGFFPQELLPALYNRAALLIYPSLYEGFGLPVLEGMACGLPVLVSNVSSLPEVAGDAGVFFDPTDVDAMAAALLAVLSNREEMQRLSRKSLFQAEKFSWERCALETLRVYERV